MTDATVARTLIKSAKKASISLAMLSEEEKNQILLNVAEVLPTCDETIIKANEKDLAKMSPDNPLYDRLKLTPERIRDIANDMKNVASLPSPLGKTLKQSTLPNGLKLTRVSVPFGVIGVVYEARPNVTLDVFSLCLKAGSACVLKGGKDADNTNRTIVEIIKSILRDQFSNVNPDIITLLPASHEATAELLHANGDVDLVIPRGSKRLIDFVRTEASVPVIETGAGVCHTYFDQDADLAKGTAIINNAKTRRVSVCNALDCAIIHSARIGDLPAICAPLAESNVLIYADTPAFNALTGNYPAHLLRPSTEESYGTEFLSYTMAIKTVDSSLQAIEHIRSFGSGHSECIITENNDTAQQFLTMVDAACVYHNAPTSFTDGAQFGLGAEIGISTQKLHARGPMALEEICTYKWIIEGDGQVRK